MLASLNLANYSEVGLIVGYVAPGSGWLSAGWPVVVALTMTFITAAPLNARAGRNVIPADATDDELRGRVLEDRVKAGVNEVWNPDIEAGTGLAQGVISRLGEDLDQALAPTTRSRDYSLRRSLVDSVIGKVRRRPFDHGEGGGAATLHRAAAPRRNSLFRAASR